MNGPEHQQRIDEQAAVWAARNALDALAAETEFEAWLAADRRHQGAYLRARASYYVLEDAVLTSPVTTASNDDDQPAFVPPRRHRWALTAGLAAAACAAFAVVVGVPGRAGWPIERSPETTTLVDGSSVVLGPDGAIASAMSGDRRDVTLERGSATFHVAKDPSRPFIVHAGQIYAEATGTVYSVRRVGAAGGAVSVTEGTVRVWAEGARDAAVLLHAGGTLTLDPAKIGAVRSVAQPAQAEEKFWFDNTSIREAAQRFNRVGGTQIVIADPAIGDTLIMGGFRADRPDRFAKAAATITGARVVERAGTLVIEKK